MQAYTMFYGGLVQAYTMFYGGLVRAVLYHVLWGLSAGRSIPRTVGA